MQYLCPLLRKRSVRTRDCSAPALDKDALGLQQNCELTLVTVTRYKT